MTATASYLLITVNAIESEKVSLSVCKILGLFFNALAALKNSPKIASIFFFIEAIQRNQFRYNYLRNKKLLLDFVLDFLT